MNINYTGPGTNLPSYNKQDRVDLFYDYKYFCKLNIYYNPSKFQFVPNYSKSCHEKTYNYYTIFYLLFLQKTIAVVMGNEFYIEKLKQMLKTQFGRDMETPADFSDLSDDIRDKLKCNTMSATTLKRLFGYIKYDKEISLSSLSLLARYLGYSGWNAFCMNDKSECYYFDEYIHGKGSHVDFYQQSNNTIKELNKYFIMSCSDISSFDRLTMWRMYADDAKGV